MNSPCYVRATQACFRFLSLRVIFAAGGFLAEIQQA